MTTETKRMSKYKSSVYEFWDTGFQNCRRATIRFDVRGPTNGVSGFGVCISRLRGMWKGELFLVLNPSLEFSTKLCGFGG